MSIPKSDSAGIRQAIRALRAAGYALHCVDDGGEYVKVTNENEAIEAITAVDSATLYVKDSAGNSRMVFFVMGNAPDEVICDYSASLACLDALIDSWIDLS